MRPSRDLVLMEIAHVIAKRGTCLRANVGAVVAKKGRIVSTGYAGAPSNLPHCEDADCNVNLPCTRTVHAEAGAISFAAREGLAVEGCTLYCTHAPCLECAKLIINAGIVRVVYNIAYRKTDGLELLQSAGVIIDECSS